MNARSTRPMDVVNDLGVILGNVGSMLELTIDALEEETESGDERMADITNALYGIRKLLEFARDRTCEARDT